MSVEIDGADSHMGTKFDYLHSRQSDLDVYAGVHITKRLERLQKTSLLTSLISTNVDPRFDYRYYLVARIGYWSL